MDKRSCLSLTTIRLPEGGYLVVDGQRLDCELRRQHAAFSTLKEAISWMSEHMVGDQVSPAPTEQPKRAA